jgi:hypothetical protein
MNDEYWLIGYEVNNKSPEEIIQKIKEHNSSHLIIVHGMEWQPYPGVKLLGEMCASNGIKTTCILGGSGSNFIESIAESHPEVNVLYWPTFWMYWGTTCLKNAGGLIEQKSRSKDPAKIPYLSMSGQPHLHRCHIIDHLHRTNLHLKGAINWLRPNNSIANNLPDGFSFRWFQEKEIRLSDGWTIGSGSSFTLPKEFDESSIILISESQWKTIFLTEKTTQALLRRKPFLCVGGKGQNHYLEEMGFKLMRDHIDYSFDLEDDVETRVIGALSQLEKWISHPNWYFLEKDLNDLLIHNHKRVYEVLEQQIHFPQIVKDMLDRNDNRYPETRNLCDMKKLKYPN